MGNPYLPSPLSPLVCLSVGVASSGVSPAVDDAPSRVLRELLAQPFGRDSGERPKGPGQGGARELFGSQSDPDLAHVLGPLPGVARPARARRWGMHELSRSASDRDSNDDAGEAPLVPSVLWRQDNFVMVLTDVIMTPAVPADILQTLLNLAEFMEREMNVREACAGCGTEAVDDRRHQALCP